MAKNPIKHVYLRNGGYWFSRMKNGVRAWVNLETKDEKEAIRKALEIVGENVLAPASPMTTEIRRFFVDKGADNAYTSNTVDNYSRWLREFANWAKDRTSRSIKKSDIEAYYKELQGNVTEASAQRVMQCLQAYFRWATEKGICIVNPTKGVKLARLVARGRRNFVSREEKNLLIECSPDDDMTFILYCGFDAGLRKEEIIEARVDWFDHQSLHVRKTDTFTPKDRDERSIPLTAPFRAFLDTYLANKRPQDFALMPSKEHGQWKYRYDFRKPFNAYMEAMGYQAEECDSEVTAHTMRHSFASILAISGVSLFKIAEWLGDDIRVVQNRYAGLAPGDGDIHKLTG